MVLSPLFTWAQYIPVVYPYQIPGLRLWLDADSGIFMDSISNVVQWDDQSGNNNHFTQSNPGNRPSYGNSTLLKGMSIQFNGTVKQLVNNTFLNGTNFPNASASMFLVWCLTGTVNEYGVISTKNGSGFWRWSGNGNGYFQNFRNTRIDGYPANMPSQGVYYSSLISSATDYIFYLNGNSKGTQASDWGYGIDFIIGRDEASNNFNGEIAEIIIYDTALNDSLRGEVENYLLNKYASAVTLGGDTVLNNSYCNLSLNAGNQYTSYGWSTGDTTSAITVDQTGQYSVTVTNIFGTTTSDTINITINRPAYIQQADTTVCGTQLIWNTGLDNTFTFQWQDNSTDSFLYINQTGTYRVTITDTYGCSNGDTANIIIDTFPQTASVGGPDTIFCAGNILALQQGAGQAVDYAWSTGDTTSNIAIYVAGTYSVTATDIYGCSVQDSINVTIQGNAPTVNFLSSAVCLGDTTPFTDLTVPDTTNTNWFWNFGDGDTSNIQNPVHVYSNADTFAVSLKVTNLAGCSQTIIKNAIVHSLPAAYFIIPPNTYKSDSILFADSSTSVSGTLSSWAWNFGDPASGNDNTSNVQNPYHVFNSLGIYSVKLIVSTNYGCSDTIIRAVAVNEFQPGDINSLILWLDADSGVTVDVNNKILQWDDISGYNHNFTQPDTAYSPVLLNSSLLKATSIQFSGGGKRLINASFLNPANFPNSSATLFMVWGINGTSNEYGVISTRSNGNGYWRWSGDGNGYFQNFRNTRLNGYPSDMPNAGVYYSTLVSSSTDYVFYMNGTSNGIQASDWGYGTDFIIGRDEAGNNLNGEIAEILIYNTALNDTLRERVENYLLNKYAPAVNLGVDSVLDNSFCNIVLDAGNHYYYYLWSTGDTAQTITVEQSGRYCVTVTNIFGNNSSDSMDVIINRPSMNFQNDSLICGDQFTWDIGLDSSFDYLWQDASVDSIFTIIQSGQYYVRITDPYNCIYYSDTISMVIDNFPNLASLGLDTTLCSGYNFGLITGYTDALIYQWSTADTTPTIILIASGDYSLTVTDSNSCIAVDTASIVINGTAPVPDFSADTACSGSDVNFTDLSSVTPPDALSSWLWSFGDGDSSFYQTPMHIYDSVAYFTVTLTVNTDSGCSNKISKTLEVHPLPEAGFSPDVTCVNEMTPFMDESSVSAGTVSFWQWSFPDMTVYMQSPSYVFTDTGYQIVTLLVKTGFGCADSVTNDIFVKPAPSAGFIVTEPSCIGDVLGFDDTSVAVFPWMITARIWNFGDMNTSTELSPSHLFSIPDTYIVSLTVTAVNGCSSAAARPVFIYNMPVADFTFSNSCVGYPVYFEDVSMLAPLNNDIINQWNWTIDSLSGINLQNPVITFETPGTYPAVLTITSSQGCMDSVIKIVSVYSLPDAGFTYTPYISVPNQNFIFNNTTSGGSTYLWNFGDSTTSSLENPLHAYGDTGRYSVEMVAISSMGCLDSVTNIVSVVRPLHDLAVTDVSVVNNANYLGVTATAINLGTTTITYGDLILKLDGESILREIFTDTLVPGKSMTYTFSAQPSVKEDYYPEFVCVEGKNPNGFADSVPENDEFCLALNNEFSVIGPFPSPSGDQITFKFILPQKDAVTLAVIDMRGRIVFNLNLSNLNKGLNVANLDVSSLHNALYAIRLNYRSDAVIIKFVKN